MSSRRAALIVGGCLTMTAAAVAARPSLWRTDEKEVQLLFTGDILLARQVQIEMTRTGESPWDSLTTLFTKADWVAGNLEGAIGADGDCRVAPGEICFATPNSAPRLLADAGFRAVSIENNHAGDAGADGRARTREGLKAAGLLGLDFAHSPSFVRFGDRTMAMIAVTLQKAADGEIQTIPSVDLAQKLRLARTLSNLVVVSIHWGNELQDWPSAEQRAAAEWLVDHGADLVVGHHPHVVQKPDCIHGRPVFFSLGNHVFDQKYPETKEGLIADCTLRGMRMRCGGLRTHARRGSAAPVLTGQTADAAMAACGFSLAPTLTVAGVALRPEPSAMTDSAESVVLEGWKDGVRRWRSRRVSLVSLQPGLATDGRTKVLFALERHPSTMDGETALRPHVYDVDGQGLVALWRGTTLAWPLIDAVVDSSGEVCALHRGDSFIRPDPSTEATRTMRYRWNGFGFSAKDTVCTEVARTSRR